MSMRHLGLLAVGMLVIVAGGLLARAGTGADSGSEERLNTLLQQRLATARQAYEAVNAAHQAETVTLDVLIEAADRLVAAELAVAGKPEEEIAARKRHVERLGELEKKHKTLFEVGNAGGEAQHYFSIKRDSESAQIDLIEAELRLKR